jgi:hypothetical protein
MISLILSVSENWNLEISQLIPSPKHLLIDLTLLFFSYQRQSLQPFVPYPNSYSLVQGGESWAWAGEGGIMVGLHSAFKTKFKS